MQVRPAARVLSARVECHHLVSPLGTALWRCRWRRRARSVSIRGVPSSRRIPDQVPMKIVSVECLPVHAGWRKNFVFVRVETDSGMVGWGEAYSQYDRDRAIAAQVEELGRYLVGRDPFQIRHILQMAFDDYAQPPGSLEFYWATSGN